MTQIDSKGSRDRVDNGRAGLPLHVPPVLIRGLVVVSCPQGKLPDPSQPGIMSPGPGLPRRVSSPSFLGSRPSTAEDRPADPGEAPLPLQ